MVWIQSIILGVVQGLTEFLPVSSSGHLELVSKLMKGWSTADFSGAAFSAIIQIGTEAAVILYFWKDIVRIFLAWIKSFTKFSDGFSSFDKDAKMGWYIVFATIPIVIAGVLFKDLIENEFRTLWATAAVLIIFGIILWIVDSVCPEEQHLEDMNTVKSVLFGLAQCLSLIPGVSRSGSTMTLGRLLKFSRAGAAKFSFYMAIPSVFGAAILEIASVFKDGEATAAFGFPGWGPTTIATIVSFVVGYAVIKWFMSVISKISYRPFAIYRVFIGIVIFALLGFGVIGA
ncbi:MAG: undecaprenyl-diphosphatase UppP [Candidatus Ancillula sp.]|jgi:undecaprenyl-diphosphatase|nr:undecaprenyl-diphosphatase UppP [Candidatus Ancillula sp.]